jgi:hypothetical protein
MSDRPIPVWTTTQISDGTLTVNYDGVVDEEWLDAANDTASAWDGETRGQTWDSIVFGSHDITVLGLRPETDVAQLRDYVAGVITAADAEYEHREVRNKRQREQQASEEEARRQAEQSLAERFRDLSDS